jgi:amino-acid N-acetyltransferase
MPQMPPTETIRPAAVTDVPAICDLVNHYAERGLMLHRSRESAYESVRDFYVAVEDDALVGCVALSVFWSDLAEVRSLAIAPHRRGAGIGSRLLAEALRGAAGLGVRRIFTLTYEQDFFARHGFEVIDRQELPEKVWRACLACPKADACDEIAMMLRI